MTTPPPAEATPPIPAAETSPARPVVDVCGADRLQVIVPDTGDVRRQATAAAEERFAREVAARAFRVRLAEIQAGGARSMSKEDVVRRLQALREGEDQKEYEEGKQAGREWAEREATPKELRRIADYIDRSDSDPNNSLAGWWRVDLEWRCPGGALGAFVFAARRVREDEQDYHVVKEFWEEALGDDVDSVQDPDFFHGFGDGVAEVWNEVKDSL